jgi:hypothetical protein
MFSERRAGRPPHLFKKQIHRLSAESRHGLSLAG